MQLSRFDGTLYQLATEFFHSVFTWRSVWDWILRRDQKLFSSKVKFLAQWWCLKGPSAPQFVPVCSVPWQLAAVAHNVKSICRGCRNADDYWPKLGNSLLVLIAGTLCIGMTTVRVRPLPVFFSFFFLDESKSAGCLSRAKFLSLPPSQDVLPVSIREAR